MSLLASFLATETVTVTKLAAELTSEELCRQGADKLFHGQFDLSPDEWVSVGMGAGMRAALVLILLTLAWTLAGWGFQHGSDEPSTAQIRRNAYPLHGQTRQVGRSAPGGNRLP